MPGTGHQFSHVLQVARQVRRHGRLADEAGQGAAGRETAPEEDVRRGVSVRLACAAFLVSETCYRYQPKLSDENAGIADWPIRLTHNQRNWGFGLFYLHLLKVQGFGWNHKRVYRIYRELALNLRIKPKKRLVREKPEPLAVPAGINEVWSMDFMQHRLSDERAFRLLSVINDYNRAVRYDWLGQYLFDSIQAVQEFATKWLWTYNHERPNMAFGGMTPMQKLAMAA